MTFNNEMLAANLRGYRARTRMTQEEVAKKLVLIPTPSSTTRTALIHQATKLLGNLLIFMALRSINLEGVKAQQRKEVI